MKIIENFIYGTIIGSFVTYVVMTIAMTNSYGRMSNHLDCDMSKANVEQLHAEKHSDCKNH